ncbi:MAG: glycosyl hydrolase family 98 [Bacteroidales bacterium]|nr:glycosyl hydrolase family 98 [Bacteroidales bacterium]
MKSITFVSFKTQVSKLLLAASALLLVAGTLAAAPLRRPVSPNQPMYLVHIDTWNYADPQKIIDLVPEDIRPYVVMNISLSISHNVETSRFQVAEYGYEIAKSWLRTCAQNRMWAVVQIASGGYSQFSDHDLSVYNELYRDYPNLIGINYAEQFWGYDDPSDPLSPKWMDRMNHLANLLELSHRYGGYVFLSWCGNQWSPSINPIGMLKRCPAFAKARETYTENFLLFEKYTQTSYQSDMESLCLGSYLSGYSGGYGIRYDDTGWTDATGAGANFSMATGASVHLEHMMLTGSTIIDGPELIWTQCFRETGRQSTTNGYSKRNWETFPQFINVTVDAFRKILDGTVRIPTRKEVIDRTKYVIINDVNTGNNDDIYSSPSSLFEGLYRMDGDGNLADNKSFFKKTGRYPTIPTVYNLNDSLAKTFPFQIKKSTYASRWSTINSKVQELNGQFPEEYTGTLYAGRHENGWVIYNPFKTGINAAASIPFKYNTCERVEVTMTQYTAGVMKEYADKLRFYLNNYDNFINLGLRNTVIKVYGSSVKPTFTYKDRGNHQASVVSEAWSEGVYTLTVTHNGALDVDINCAGTATERLTAYTEATLVQPTAPPFYTGPLQYEAECFDYKSISGITTGGQYGNIRNYTGQGYLRVGTSASASVRDTVTVLRAGKYTLKTRYAVTGGNVTSLDLLVNGVKVATPIFRSSASESDWKEDVRTINLKAGANEIILRATRSGSYSLVLDNMVITDGIATPNYAFNNETASDSATTPAAEFITVLSGSAGVALYTDNSGLANNGLKTYSSGSLNGTGVAELDLFPNRSGDYSVIWRAGSTTDGSKMGLLLRANGEAGSCAYAEGLKQGYLFIVNYTADQRLLLKPYVAGASGLTAKATHTSSFTVPTNKTYWLRASAYGSNLVFECSSDSLNWEGAASTTFTDTTYIVGGTQLVWGLNSNNFSGVMDNLTLLESQLSTSVLKLANLTYTQGHGPSVNDQFTVAAGHLYDTLELRSNSYFELSLTPQGGFDSVVHISPLQAAAGNMPVYVRLKAGLPIGSYQGTLTLKSGLATSPSIDLSGTVTPSPETRSYHFDYDKPSTIAQTPPAMYLSIGKGSTTSGGVVRYADTRSYASNMFKPYNSGQRNATGTINLDRFSKTATDYSVTWRQAIHSGTSDTKIGVLLRGDPNKVGNGSTGYVEGLMQGYLFIVYNANSGSSPRTEFRIYRSTEVYNQLNMMANSTAASFVSTAKQSLWYRASVSGAGPVSLKLEYSSDSINWATGAQASDNGLTVFTAGATQLAWGLGVGDLNFFMDDICFEGVESASGAIEDAIKVSGTSLATFSYVANNGPSTAQSFVVSGSKLVDDIHLEAPAGFELSRSVDTGYAPYLALTRTGSDVASTTVYVRLKAGLTKGDYAGTIDVSAISAIGQSIAVAGQVAEDPNALDRPSVSAFIVSETYHNLAGQPLVGQPVTDGLYLVKTVYSDGKVVVEKKVASSHK